MKLYHLLASLLLFFSCEFPDLSSSEKSDFEKSLQNRKGKEVEYFSSFIPFYKDYGILNNPETDEWIMHLNPKNIHNRVIRERESHWINVLAVGKNKKGLIVESDGEYFEDYGKHPCTLIVEFKSNKCEVYINAFELDKLDKRRKQLNLDIITMYNVRDIKTDYLENGTLPPTWN